MAQGLFVVGFTVAEVLALQAVAKQNLLNNVVQTSWTMGETSSGSSQAMSTMSVLDECAYALQQLDPATYPKKNRAICNFGHVCPKPQNFNLLG